MSANSETHPLSPDDVTAITRRWRKAWSDRSRSETVTKLGAGFFFWRSGADGMGASGMFFSRAKIDDVMVGSGMEAALRQLIDETNHEMSVVVVLAFEEQGKAMAVTVEKLDPPREKAWFEMTDIRRRSITKSVWIPIRASNKLLSQGRYGYEGYCEEFYGLGSVMFDVSIHDSAMTLGWTEIGIRNSYSGGTITSYSGPGGEFESKAVADFRVPLTKLQLRILIETPSTKPKKTTTFLRVGDYEDHRSHALGTGLVIEQTFNSHEKSVWNLHQDFVVSLGLMREGDIWVRPEEGYVQVARLTRDEAGDPIMMEVRAEHLRDYLKARNMNLYIASYRSRREIRDSASDIVWTEMQRDETVEHQLWEGRVSEIHEGGGPYGAETAVFHVARTDVDDETDVPRFDFPTDESVESKSWKTKSSGRKLYSIMGELWNSDVINPGASSERVLSEEVPSSVEFTVDAAGNREAGSSLQIGSRWLWFKPEVVPCILRGRGAFLKWYTRETGALGLLSGSGLHFGINGLGLLNVYAKDIAMLPVWQQRIWSGFNVTPEGGVSTELLDSQMRADPARTQAPEAYLRQAYDGVNEECRSRTGKTLFRSHKITDELLHKVHRFRALDQAGLLELAKDLARLTVESIDGAALGAITAAPSGFKPGSIKHLELVLAKFRSEAEARSLTAVLAGINELRQADAHMPTENLSESMRLAGVANAGRATDEARQMLHSLVDSLFGIASAVADAPRE